MGASGDQDAELELELPSEPTSVRVARHAVAAVARSSGAPEADVKLAVSEAVSNAVTHAFRDRDPGKIMSAPASTAAAAGDRSPTTGAACVRTWTARGSGWGSP